MASMFFARFINIIFNSLLVQLVKYDVHTTRKIKFIHVIIYHILLLYLPSVKPTHRGCSAMQLITTLRLFPVKKCVL